MPADVEIVKKFKRMFVWMFVYFANSGTRNPAARPEMGESVFLRGNPLFMIQTIREETSKCLVKSVFSSVEYGGHGTVTGDL